MREREGVKEAACVLSRLNVKIAHAIISDEKVGTEWICFNITDMGYHIQRDRGGGQTSLLLLTQWKGPDRCAFVCVCLCEGEADCVKVCARVYLCVCVHACTMDKHRRSVCMCVHL